MPASSDGGAGIRLVTRGDDAANTETTNRAVLAAFEEGLLRNVSVMAPAPALADAADRLAGVDGLCVGLHVTLTSEWDRPRWGPVCPAAEVPSLVDDDGYFPRDPERLAARDPDPGELRREALAQLDRLREAGFDVDYFDDHMWVREAGEFGETLSALTGEGLLDGHAVVDRLSPDDWPRTEAALIGALGDADPGTYLVVGHPGYVTPETRRIVGGPGGREPGEWAAVMDQQRRLFTGEAVREYCADRDIEPIRYTEA